jgi:hypothetical protein
MPPSKKKSVIVIDGDDIVMVDSDDVLEILEGTPHLGFHSKQLPIFGLFHCCSSLLPFNIYMYSRTKWILEAATRAISMMFKEPLHLNGSISWHIHAISTQKSQLKVKSRSATSLHTGHPNANSQPEHDATTTYRYPSSTKFQQLLPFCLQCAIQTSNQPYSSSFKNSGSTHNFKDQVGCIWETFTELFTILDGTLRSFQGGSKAWQCQYTH